MRGERSRQDAAKAGGIVGAAKAFERCRVADEARNASQCLEVIAACLLGREQKEQQIDRLAVVAQKAADLWRMLDARLATREYVGGAALTMADLALGNAVHRWYKFAIERPDLPSLRAWYDRLCKRPAYQKHVASI